MHRCGIGKRGVGLLAETAYQISNGCYQLSVVHEKNVTNIFVPDGRTLLIHVHYIILSLKIVDFDWLKTFNKNQYHTLNH